MTSMLRIFLIACCLLAIHGMQAFTGMVWGQSESGNAESRVQDSLVSLYTFEQFENGVVLDRSGVGEPLNLRVDKPQNVQFRDGRFVVQASVIIASDGPAKKIISAIKSTHELTIEAWLKPLDNRQTGPARIVSISADPSQRNVTLGQDKQHFDLRLRTESTDGNGQPSTGTLDGTVNTLLTHVVCTRSISGETRFYIDGRLLVTKAGSGSLNNWDDGFRLSLANEVSGDRPWLGELSLVAIYGRSLTSDEVLQNFHAGKPATKDYAKLLPAAAEHEVDFVRHIQPLFQKHCFECHSADSEDGGVNLGIRQRAMQGGDHGPIFVANDGANSRLVHLAAGLDKDLVMPPDSEGLSDEDIALLRAWIDQGAKWPEGVDIADPREEQAKTHWAFQPLHAVEVPVVHNAGWCKTDIDAFLLARLEQEGIAPQSSASARQLIRRISLDLVGLPPTPEEVTAFCESADQDVSAAIDSLVDRLLDSRQYGERWGRHWLDVARYADSDGQESDRDRNTAYRYRDFVIRAFNEDMPYDEFVRWQLAGDEYEPNNPQAVSATGFLAAGPFAALPDRLMEDERLRNRFNELDDMLSTVGTGLLGLTLGCVRCHDHKYDAIPARDYYSLLSAFQSGQREEVPLGNTQETVLAYRDFGPTPQPAWLFQRGNYYDRDQPVTLGFVSILTNGKSPQAYWAEAHEQSPLQNSTHQRRAIAEWMTDCEHGAGALLARVIVNRLWQHHFGEGLVRTVGDFGVRSDAPTHPELLEWLANDFVAHGWQMKRLQRMIVTSAVFQQQSRGAAPNTDPENRLLWKMPLQRVEGEVLRDCMLAVSGTLNLESYGPAVKPPIASEAIVARNLTDSYPNDIQDDSSLRRRSVYLFHKRVVPYPFLQAFDKPDAQQSCSRRDRTTVAPQALALMNDPFARMVATEFAGRLIAGSSLEKDEATRRSIWIEQGYQWALSREPKEAERTAAEKFIESQMAQRSARESDSSAAEIQLQAVADFCQVLFSLNEFVYID